MVENKKGGSQKVTTYFHKSGIGLLEVSSLNGVVWLDNDVVSNTVSQPVKTNLGPPQTKPAASEPSLPIRTEEEVYTLGNNAMGISNKVHRQVSSAILAVEILSEVVASILI